MSVTVKIIGSSRLGQAVARLDLDQRRVVIAEGVVRFDLQRRRIADFLAVEFFFDFWQGVFIATVQIDHWLATVFDQVVLSIGQFVVHCNDRILGNFHGASFHC
jgi:hypothetical protein